MNIQIAKNNSMPTHSVLVDGLWDCDCASNSQQATLQLAAEKYQDWEVIMWDSPEHYSNQ